MQTRRLIAPFLLLTIFVIFVVLFSFLTTTYILMILGGAIGHITHSQWLQHLGFWKYAPVWFVLVAIRLAFA